MANKAQHSLSTLGYALLGLIKMQPSNGYELRRIFEQTPMARYSSSPGSIYPALRSLDHQNLIQGKTSTGKKGRSTKTWRCTAAGARALNAWLRRDVTLEELSSQLDVILLRFSYLDLLNDPEWSVAFLQQFRRAAKQAAMEVATLREKLAPQQPLHGQLALLNGVTQLEAHVDWATKALKRVKQESKT